MAWLCSGLADSAIYLRLCRAPREAAGLDDEDDATAAAVQHSSLDPGATPPIHSANVRRDELWQVSPAQNAPLKQSGVFVPRYETPQGLFASPRAQDADALPPDWEERVRDGCDADGLNQAIGLILCPRR